MVGVGYVEHTAWPGFAPCLRVECKCDVIETILAVFLNLQSLVAEPKLNDQ